ncbi:MAG: PEP/pyruvate-binding domain-containing protein [Xanthomonadales bacterium]|nr:PEP/pyruvate-binding domain-containing protein [Xanthomonadales bacterium]
MKNEAKSPSHDPGESRRRIESGLSDHPRLFDRVHRALLILLHSRGITTIDEIYRRIRARALPGLSNDAVDQNGQSSARWNEQEKQLIQQLTLETAAQAFRPSEIDDLINLTIKREEAKTLEEIANLSTVSFGLIAERVKAFCTLPEGQSRIPESEALAVRVALIRHFISDQLEFIGVAKHYLTIRDFEDLVDHVIGTDAGLGRIGGKAAGLLLARCILDRAQKEDPEAPRIRVRTPRSYYLRSDVIEQFLKHAGLVELQSHKYKSIEEIHNEYGMIREVFRNAEFPPAIASRLRAILEELGPHPLIVRSSSLLEDRFGAAFAGKYRSVFLANQGNLDRRLQALLGAVAEVYASTLHADPISYRKKRQLLDYDENMAVLIQKVVGMRYRHYFLPCWAGVGFSVNEYRRNPRVRPEDGLVRLVCGLGSRAVDRVSSDWARMVPLGTPTLRPEVRPEDIWRYSQREVDVLNLASGSFETLPLTGLLEEAVDLPGLDQVVSVMDHGFIRRPIGSQIFEDPADLVVTFDRLTHDSDYPGFLRWVLKTLEKAYGCPVEIEFAHDGREFYLLQCRPQVTRGVEQAVRVASNIPADRRVFSASRDIDSAAVHGVEYIVLIDPRHYNRLESSEDRQGVARVVRKLNERLHDRPFILMGPGRWGSRDMRMGVHVGYADINYARMLIEIARPVGGFVPEVSFGSHFFQDLIESRICYLALYPEETGNLFNEDFLHGTANALTSILPDESAFSRVVRVIDVAAVSNGLLLNVDMDGDAQEALAYLA